MPKFEKGSKEAKEWGLKMKQAKEAKKKEKEDLAPITLDDLEPFDDDYETEFQITPSTKVTKYSKYVAKKKAKEKAEKVKQVKFRQQTLDLPFDMKKEILGFLPSFTKKDKDRLEEIYTYYLDYNTQLLDVLEVQLEEYNITISKKLKDKVNRVRTKLYDLQNKIKAILDKNGVEFNEDSLYYEMSDINNRNLENVGFTYEYDNEEDDYESEYTAVLDKDELDDYLVSLNNESIGKWKKEITEIGDKQLPFKPIK